MKRNKSIPLGLALVGVIAIIATLGLFSLNQAATVQAQTEIANAVEGESDFGVKYFTFISPDDLEKQDDSKFIIDLGDFTVESKAALQNIKVYTEDGDGNRADGNEQEVQTSTDYFVKGQSEVDKGDIGDASKLLINIETAKKNTQPKLIGQNRQIWIEIPIDMEKDDQADPPITKDLPGADIRVPEKEGRYTICVGISTDGGNSPNYEHDSPVGPLGSGACKSVVVQNFVEDVVMTVEHGTDDEPYADGSGQSPQFGEEDPAEVTVEFNTRAVVGIDEGEFIAIKLGSTFDVPPSIPAKDKKYVTVNDAAPDKIVMESGNTVKVYPSKAIDLTSGDGKSKNAEDVTVVFKLAAGIMNPQYGDTLEGKDAVTVYTEAATKPVVARPFVEAKYEKVTDKADGIDPTTPEISSGGVVIPGTMVDNVTARATSLGGIAGGETGLTIKFTTDDPLIADDDKAIPVPHDTITLGLSGFTLPDYIDEGVKVNGRTANVEVEPNDVPDTIEIEVPADIEASQRRRVTVEIENEAGIRNPALAAAYQITVMTSQENEEAKLSDKFQLVGPTGPTVVQPTITLLPDTPGAISRMSVVFATPDELVPGDLIVITLEDDWKNQVSIPLNNDLISMRASQITNTRGVGSAAVRAAGVTVGLTGIESDMPTISLEIPDMDLNEDGSQTIKAGSTVTVIFNQGSGISNPTEGGKYDARIQTFMGSLPKFDTRDILQFPNGDPLKNHVLIPALLELSAASDSRNEELTMVAKGVEGGESVTFWLDSGRDSNGNGVLDPEDEGYRDGVRNPFERDLICTTVAASDDTATCTATLTNPPFRPGGIKNFINFEDSEYRTVGSTDGEKDGGSEPSDYPGLQRLINNALVELDPLVTISPDTVNTGDRVTISLFDYGINQAITEIRIGNIVVAQAEHIRERTGSSGEVSFSFEIPSRGVAIIDGRRVINRGLRLPTGKLRVDVVAGLDPDDTKDNVNITIAGALLTTTADSVVANQHVSISGNGFTSSGGGSGEVCIAQGDITFNGVALEIIDDDDCGLEGVDGIELTSGGTFTLTVGIRQEIGRTIDMPTSLLTSGDHQLKVVDTEGTEGSIALTVPERTLVVSPEVARPRDIVTIRGENFIADNPDGVSVGIEIQYFCDGKNRRTVSGQPDSSGNFTETLRIPTDCAIPSTNSVKADIEVNSVKVGIVDTVVHDIPEATVVVAPASGAPGNAFTVTGLGYRTYDTVTSVTIGGREALARPDIYHTDRDGNLEIPGLLVPGMDAGLHPVIVTVGSKDRRTTASGTIQVLEEGAVSVPTGVMGAVEPLGESLIRIFHFNNSDKSWSFYDPRPEFAEFNSIDRMFSGQIYWVNVTEDMTLTLNNETRTFTCIEGDCWNQIVW